MAYSTQLLDAARLLASLGVIEGSMCCCNSDPVVLWGTSEPGGLNTSTGYPTDSALHALAALDHPKPPPTSTVPRNSSWAVKLSKHYSIYVSFHGHEMREMGVFLGGDGRRIVTRDKSPRLSELSPAETDWSAKCRVIGCQVLLKRAHSRPSRWDSQAKRVRRPLLARFSHAVLVQTVADGPRWLGCLKQEPMRFRASVGTESGRFRSHKEPEVWLYIDRDTIFGLVPGISHFGCCKEGEKKALMSVLRPLPDRIEFELPKNTIILGEFRVSVFPFLKETVYLYVLNLREQEVPIPLVLGTTMSWDYEPYYWSHTIANLMLTNAFLKGGVREVNSRGSDGPLAVARASAEPKRELFLRHTSPWTHI
ncbi:hypothetical protein M407DRAFT_8339 [Tulasnella calospora MUT 4182]|uniref:Uncharacterized protein n=1 Tax=Tulasnella calospora MUT 4182 TaxID=1051891 RepID=A0A0C3QI14_9AGAM|nr:hypothetical protein M407DRAFT_8339 [Tulasnella calospora MUT 4182]